MLVRLGDRHLGFSLRKLRARLFQLALSLGDLPACLVYHGLKRPRIDLKQQLALFHEATFCVGLLHEAPGDLRFDVCVDQPVERANPLAVNRHILLLHGRHLDLQRRRRRGRAIAARAASGDDQHSGRRG